MFRDEASLSVNPGLWSSIEIALGASQSARSDWVGKEVNYWVSHRPLANFLIALTDGELVWDHSAVEQRKLAVRQRNLAVSRLLAAVADAKASTDLQQAMLLSAAGFKFSDTAEARSSLVRQLQRSQQLGAPRIERFLAGSTSPVNGLVYSPDGRLIASTSRNNKLVLWDAAPGCQLTTLSAGDWMRGPVFSPDGHILAAGAGNMVDGGKVILWDVARRSRVASFNLGDSAAHAVRGLAFSPAGRILASGDYGNQDIVLWDVPRRRRWGAFSSQSGGPVSSLAFDSDGGLLAWNALQSANTAIGGDFSIIVWDVKQNTARATFTVHTGLASTVAFSWDGRMLAWDGDNVVLWSVGQGTRMATLTDPDRPGGRVFLRDPVFSPDGRVLATTSSDGNVILWDVDARSWSHQLCLMPVVISPERNGLPICPTSRTRQRAVEAIPTSPRPR